MDERMILDKLEMIGAILTENHFVLNSGKHAKAYINKDEVYLYTGLVSDLCRKIAWQFKDDGVDVVVAPAIGGVILSSVIASHLTQISGRKVFGVYAERDEESLAKATHDNTQITISGKTFTLQKGEEVVIKKNNFIIKRGYPKRVVDNNALVIDDIITTGGSAKLVVKAVRVIGGNVVGVGALCNRGEVTSKDVGDVPKLFSLAHIKFPTWDEEECQRTGPCSQDVPINTDVGKGKDFLARKKAG